MKQNSIWMLSRQHNCRTFDVCRATIGAHTENFVNTILGHPVLNDKSVSVNSYVMMFDTIDLKK
jgi:hypothetical protein